MGMAQLNHDINQMDLETTETVLEPPDPKILGQSGHFSY